MNKFGPIPIKDLIPEGSKCFSENEIWLSYILQMREFGDDYQRLNNEFNNLLIKFFPRIQSLPKEVVHHATQQSLKLISTYYPHLQNTLDENDIRETLITSLDHKYVITNSLSLNKIILDIHIESAYDKYLHLRTIRGLPIIEELHTSVLNMRGFIESANDLSSINNKHFTEIMGVISNLSLDTTMRNVASQVSNFWLPLRDCSPSLKDEVYFYYNDSKLKWDVSHIAEVTDTTQNTTSFKVKSAFSKFIRFLTS